MSWSSLHWPSFARPGVALAAPIVFAAVIAIFAIGEQRRRVLVGRLGELPLVRRMMNAASPARRRIKAALLAIGAALLMLAAAGPGRHGISTSSKRGLDLVIALDASKSMMAGDLAPDRLSHARAAVISLLGQLDADRVGVVVFAGGAIHFPLSDDKDVTAKLLEEIGPLDLPPGSDVAEALRLGRCMLRPDVYDSLGCGRVGGRGEKGRPLELTPQIGGDHGHTAPDVDEERGKAIMVVTDGGGDVERAKEEIERARALGISIFWVGVGTEQGADVPELDGNGKPIPGEWKHDRQGEVVHSKLDRPTLEMLATAGGDVHRYLDLPPAVIENGERVVDARPLVDALADVKRGARLTSVERTEDVSHWFLYPAFLLFVIEACIGTRRRVLYPEGQPEQDKGGRG